MTTPSGILVDLVQRGYRFALSLTNDPARADDLLQDAWLSVLKVDGPWEHAYLFRAIRSRFVDQYRCDLRAKALHLDSAAELKGETTDNYWGYDDAVSSNGTLDTALGQLRPEERAVLYLAAVEDLSAGKIGELLDWPRGTVLSMLHRTRDKLRQLMRLQEGPTT